MKKVVYMLSTLIMTTLTYKSNFHDKQYQQLWKKLCTYYLHSLIQDKCLCQEGTKHGFQLAYGKC